MYIETIFWMNLNLFISTLNRLVFFLVIKKLIKDI